MKKFLLFALILVLLCGFSISIYAEELNLKSMDYENLQALKHAVDLEYSSRPESKPTTLSQGNYIVGKDIIPGRYYFMSTLEVNNEASLYVYENEETLKENNYIDFSAFDISNGPKSIILKEGNIVSIQYGNLIYSASEIPDEYLYHYEVPEGTYVQAGTYAVGESGDIPAGTYTVQAGTIKGASARLYSTQEKYQENEFKCDKSIRVPILSSELIKLEEGNVLRVESDIVMKKGKKLVFD